jgi:hypothetical protein
VSFRAADNKVPVPRGPALEVPITYRHFVLGVRTQVPFPELALEFQTGIVKGLPERERVAFACCLSLIFGTSACHPRGLGKTAPLASWRCCDIPIAELGNPRPEWPHPRVGQKFVERRPAGKVGKLWRAVRPPP